MGHLIHFQSTLHHPRQADYIGFVEGDLGRRIALHRLSRGAEFLAAVNDVGIEWHVVRIWRGADRCFERRLTASKKARCSTTLRLSIFPFFT